MVELSDPLQDQYDLAKRLENEDKWEPAYKNFHDVAQRAIQEMNFTTDAARKQYLKDFADRAITDAQWAKQMIEDQKQNLHRQVKVSSSAGSIKTGLAFLGKNFRQAFQFYQDLGNFYFESAAKDKRALQPAKLCYVIAAQNAIEIAKLY